MEGKKYLEDAAAIVKAVCLGLMSLLAEDDSPLNEFFVYNSPDLKIVRERLKINREMVERCINILDQAGLVCVSLINTKIHVGITRIGIQFARRYGSY